MDQKSQHSQMGRHSREADPLPAHAGNDVAVVLGPRIYLVDPDPLTRALLADYLRGKGFDILATTHAEAALPSVDAMIVALEGTEPRANRPQWLMEKPDVPTIILDRSYVFPGRAAPLGFVPDARLSLPIHPRKLVATIRRVLSIARIESLDPCESSIRAYLFAGWSLYVEDRRLASHDGRAIQLDKREFEVLKVLLTFPRQLLTRQQLIAIVWGADMDIKNGALDRQITRLRRHLGDDVKFPELIKTVFGSGYRLDADVEKVL